MLRQLVPGLFYLNFGLGGGYLGTWVVVASADFDESHKAHCILDLQCRTFGALGHSPDCATAERIGP